MDSTAFKIIGHRGACGYAPENTLDSFEKAIALGVAWVEFDVQFSCDGVAMVLHDATLHRTTALSGRVAHTPAMLLRERVGRDGLPVPTLDEVLRLLARHDVGAYVELKACPRGALPGLLEQLGPARGDRILSSFHHAWLREARRLSPHVLLQPLFSRAPLCKPDWLDAMEPAEVGVGFDGLAPSSCARINRWGYPVVSYTVNEQADIDRAFDMGLAGVFCDFPDRLPHSH